MSFIQNVTMTAVLNPQLLIWARETAGLSQNDAVQKLGLTSAEKLEILERGEHTPSRPLLLKMSKEYRRPLLTFYLAAPPRKADIGQDFRTTPDNRSITDDSRLDALLRDLKVRQNLVKSTLEDEDETESVKFIGTTSIEQGVPHTVNSMMSYLKISLADFRRQKTPELAFSWLRNKVELSGVFVLLIGNLGSHHSNIPIEAFRGFAVADNLAPFIAINDQDAKTAWSFTLLHELAHLWLGQTGVSGGWAETKIEQFCNDVAGEFLLPISELKELIIERGMDSAKIIDILTPFAIARNISRQMVSYKLFRSGIINHGQWRSLDSALRQLWVAQKAAVKEKNRGNDDSTGPSFYVVRRHRLGKALIDFVGRTVSEGLLSPVKAAKVLGVKPRNVHPLLNASQYNASGGNT
jgi:Zn-dependent peptidase ImmA (M78 family)